jgi:hypothetical protein
VSANCAQRTGLYAGWELEFRLLEPLLTKKYDDEVKNKSSAMFVLPELKPGFAIC